MNTKHGYYSFRTASTKRPRSAIAAATAHTANPNAVMPTISFTRKPMGKP